MADTIFGANKRNSGMSSESLSRSLDLCHQVVWIPLR
jgi:hypothetical protein